LWLDKKSTTLDLLVRVRGKTTVEFLVRQRESTTVNFCLDKAKTHSRICG